MTELYTPSEPPSRYRASRFEGTRMQRNQDADKDDQAPKPERKGIRPIRLMPFAIDDIRLSFFVHVLLILRGWIMIEKAHQRTVCDKRYDVLSFVGNTLKQANPQTK